MSLQAERPWWRSRSLVLGAVLVIATLIAHSPSLGGGFIWDDDDYIVDNADLRDGAGFVELWKPGTTKQYYPLVFTTFWIEYQIWGPNPAGFHLTNLLLHALNALLAWRLFHVLGVRGAWMIGAVFALHPVHVESVAWASERKNVLSAALYLGAALTYLRFDRLRFEAGTPDRRAWGAYAITLVLFSAALLSKTVTCSLPAALGLALLWQRRQPSIRRLAPLLPLFAMGLALALHTAHLEKTSVGAVGSDFDIGLIDRGLIAARALLFYPVKLLVPYPTVFIYPRWAIEQTEFLAWVPVLVVVAVAIGMTVSFARGTRGVAFALAFYAGTIFPVLGFIDIYPMRYTFVADHYQYLASLGIIAAIVGAGAAAIERHDARLGRVRASAALAACWLVVLGLLTHAAGAKYASLESLWVDTIAANPDCWMCHNNLGNVLVRRDALEEALPHYEAALAIKPDHYQSRANLASTLDALGRHDEAIVAWRATLENERATPGDRADMAFSLERAGRLDAAEATYLTVLETQPGDLSTRRRLGDLLVRGGRPDEAAPHYAVVAAANPAAVRLQLWLGTFGEAAGDHASAERHYRLAMDHAVGDADRVVSAFRYARLLALCPDERFRRPHEALPIAEQLARLTRGGDPLVLDTLAAAQAGTGRLDEAIATAERALAVARRSGAPPALLAEIEGRLQGYLSE